MSRGLKRYYSLCSGEKKETDQGGGISEETSKKRNVYPVTCGLGDTTFTVE